MPAPRPASGRTGTPARRAPDLLEVLVHLSAPTPHLHNAHLPTVHLPTLRLPTRVGAASALLTVVHLAALAVAVTAPAGQALAGCLVLAGLVSRWAVRRRRSVAAAVPAARDAVDTVLAADTVLPASPLVDSPLVDSPLVEEPAHATA
ncbi:hypothetical protein [Modestobacter roseus]|uniref:hypothetical protein n=1 Tax=Modestobacter roseus TaxID=1181884 RepID=UPI0034DFF5C2